MNPHAASDPQIAQVCAEARDPRTHAIIGAAMGVHRELGHGFLEAVYQEALAIEFEARQLPFRREVELRLRYKNRRLACGYRADFICFDDIVVELKALAAITNVELSQAINYLKATGHGLGLLINFGAPSLGWKRVVLSQSHLRNSAQSADENA